MVEQVDLAVVYLWLPVGEAVALKSNTSTRRAIYERVPCAMAKILI